MKTLNKAAFGMPITENHILITSETALDKRNGSVKVGKNLADLKENVSEQPVLEVKKEVDIVETVSEVVVDLSLVSDVPMQVVDGFLIEVFLSGSDGTLTRVYQKDISDPVTQDLAREGFENYLVLEVDK